ncbi:vitamin D3 receptor-like isoform X1 [Haliotis cracherodii]|uniref:vitamin D3 receptor-like isoform X1 n=1 Tax=Haliotis cracherodii TaxID=6455 RepID=UPI0039EC87DA
MASSGEENNWVFEDESVSLRKRDEYGQSRPKIKKEQKRRPKPKDGTQMVCGVCGDKALGYNFDAVTCESCKAFFRRNALKAKTFSCSFDGNCKLDPHTRKFCSGCRLKKCFTIGMKKDWILSDDQLAKRRRRLKDTKSPDRSEQEPLSSSESPSGSSAEVSTSYNSDGLYSPTFSEHSPPQPSPSHATTNNIATKSEPDDNSYPVPLPEDVRLSIAEIEQVYTSIFDAPYHETQAMRLETQPQTSNDLFNMTDIFIRRLIKFAKLIPEFRALAQEDQIHLLKGGIMEIFVLRSAMGFDKQQQMWKYKMGTGTTSKLSPTIIKDTLGHEMYTEHVKFVKSFHVLTGSNRIVMMLLFIIELFSSDRPNLKNKALVAKGQEKYSMWLQTYLESLYSVTEARSLYPKLLLKLLDVRNLGETSSQLASQLDVSKLEPLLVEVFNLNS